MGIPILPVPVIRREGPSLLSKFATRREAAGPQPSLYAYGLYMGLTIARETGQNGTIYRSGNKTLDRLMGRAIRSRSLKGFYLADSRRWTWDANDSRFARRG